ncbi:PD-(D/E)XK nuclease family protein [Engelhardtia mirabilis]|uniref:PD-(D/E)XK nuclease superfamily protein n=1 Tax=Engelhardtia mirabilis TaxID=2528011 RepID=A0A518BP17_9BACT|nr:PD-(D/E)XK nuclease superfamily protein [Planctomycetes bacterium Pla133]QDV03046.1 PD-(D/E)XK nuclease superfamily protein [Planctomycetes bacterium Pla86]
MEGEPQSVPGPRPWRVDGPRASRDLAIALARRHAATVRADPRELAHPLRLVVASSAARQHLAADLTAALGHSIAGLSITSLEGLALECLERGGVRAPRGERLAGLLVERAAADERELKRPLGDLEGGLAAARRSVADLLAAGFHPDHADSLAERLDDEERPAGSRAERARAKALVRVARAVESQREALASGGRPALLATAAATVRRGLVGGLDRTVVLALSDERGVALDLVEALASRGATVVVEEPLLPGEEQVLPGPERERFGPPIAPPAELGDELQLTPATFEYAVACDADAEARFAADRARRAIAAGVAPERIAIVARDQRQRGALLRAQLDRAGVPWTLEPGAAPIDPGLHALRALLTLAVEDGRAPLSRLVDAIDSATFLERGGFDVGPEPLADLRAGFATLGLGRLADLAALDVDARLRSADGLSLPVRRGLESDADDDASPGAHAPRRRLAKGLLQAAADLGRELLECLAGAEQDLVSVHAARLAEACDLLGWDASGAPRRVLSEICAGLARELPADLALTRGEWFELVASALESRGRAQLPGAGGGVQLLSAPNARGLAFELTILVGVERDAFPRTPREDPLLPDRVRDRLREVLPDLSTARARQAGEARLFASLLASAPTVVISRAEVDETGANRAPSPLLARMGGALPEPVDVRPVHSARGADDAPRSGLDHLIRASLAGDREAFAPLAALALAELDGLAEASEPQLAVAAARAAVLGEVDRPAAGPEGERLSPWLGAVGAARANDPRGARLFATLLEDVAGCGWQAFLRRMLRLEPVGDPLEALPSIDTRLVGILVHDVLEAWVNRARSDAAPRTLDEAREAGAVQVPRPGDAELEALLVERAQRVARDEGLAHPGLVRVLIEQARPMLSIARELEWRDGAPLSTLGAELEGELTLADSEGAERPIAFRADRVDLVGDGSLRLTDYKSGAPFSRDKTDKTRNKKLMAAVAQGQRLQAAAYALGTGGEGRYLFLRAPADAFPDDARELRLAAGDAGLEAAFHGAGAAVLDALREGALPPRLVDERGDEPARCSYCEVAEACVRGDSGARGRISAFVERLRGAGPPEDMTTLEATWFALWELASAKAPEAAPSAQEDGSKDAGSAPELEAAAKRKSAKKKAAKKPSEPTEDGQ